MVNVAHSPPVRGKAGHEDVVSRRPLPSKETAKKEKSKQNGGLPHLVLVRAHHPKANAVVPSSPPAPFPAPNNHSESVPARPAVQTRAQPTSTAPSTVVCGGRNDGEHSVSPQVALRYTTDILSRWSDRALSRQQSLDDRLQQLHSRVRGRQGRAMCRHVQSQIKSARRRRKGEGEREEEEGEEKGEEGEGEGKREGKREEGEGERKERGSSPVVPAALPMQVDGAVDDIGTSRVVRTLQFHSCDESDQSKRTESSDSTDMEISVDMDTAPPKQEIETPPPLLNKSDNLAELLSARRQSGESDPRPDRRAEVLERWRQQLRGVCGGGLGGAGGERGECGEGEGEVTDVSSDEEEEEEEDSETGSITQNRYGVSTYTFLADSTRKSYSTISVPTALHN